MEKENNRKKKKCFRNANKIKKVKEKQELSNNIKSEQ